jgi:hypothetical protein
LQNAGIFLLTTTLVSNMFSYGWTLWQGLEKAASTQGAGSDLVDQIAHSFSENATALGATSVYALFSLGAYTLLSKVTAKSEENNRMFEIVEREQSDNELEQTGIGFLNSPRGLDAIKKIADNARQNRPN